MLPWILATLALFVVQTLLPNSFRFLRLARPKVAPELVKALGPRDEMPPLGVYGERAYRASINMQEALPVFLTLAILNHVKLVTPELAVHGASVFFIARVLYVPSYIFGVFGLRSVVWVAGWGGLFMMAAALL